MTCKQCNQPTDKLHGSWQGSEPIRWLCGQCWVPREPAKSPEPRCVKFGGPLGDFAGAGEGLGGLRAKAGCNDAGTD